MSTGTAASDAETLRNEELMNVLGLILGSIVVFAGMFVLFASSPTMSIDPVFDVSSIEPVLVIANMAVGASITAAGAVVAIPKLDDLLDLLS